MNMNMLRNFVFVLKNMHTGAARFCAKCILVYVLFMHFGDRYCPDHCWYQRRNVSLEYRIIQSDFKIQFETYGAVPLSSSLQLSMLMVLFWALSALCVCIVFVMIAVVKRKNVWLRMERLFGIIYAAPSFLANNVSSISVSVKQFNLPFCYFEIWFFLQNIPCSSIPIHFQFRNSDSSLFNHQYRSLLLMDLEQNHDGKHWK